MDYQQALRQYNEYSSDFGQWDQKPYTEQYLLYDQNIGPTIAIDEVALSKGELVTIVTNKAAKGKKGSLVAMIAGTRMADISSVLNRIPEMQRALVAEVTMDMAKNMEVAILRAFPQARRETDRFHVSQLLNDVVQGLRIKQRWVELEREAEAIKTAKEKGLKYKPEELLTGESPKQLLARSRYILYKNAHKWTPNQHIRSLVLFHQYPHLKEAHEHGQAFLSIYTSTHAK